MAALPGDLFWDTSRLYTTGELFVGSPVDSDADLDGSGAVNAGDLAILKSFFFRPPGPSALAP